MGAVDKGPLSTIGIFCQLLRRGGEVEKHYLLFLF